MMGSLLPDGGLLRANAEFVSINTNREPPFVVPLWRVLELDGPQPKQPARVWVLSMDDGKTALPIEVPSDEYVRLHEVLAGMPPGKDTPDMAFAKRLRMTKPVPIKEPVPEGAPDA